ncbi:hypothetical protein QR680_010212 [Steinernema hermaphroditum]|uniref:Uncharacterized protein n=1 Tax=Steinernema hermaphroditum TaxID=289476 RepID=A0AA39IQM3_9BILA|nr:hypothetical protein QR680_010212 [Steinernema hermaphroditum]
MDVLQVDDLTMVHFKLIAGIIYIVLCLFFVPIYLRFVYIFLTRSKYRSLECYRIMIQMGIVQCFTMAPGFIFFGVVLLLDYDPLGLANVFIVLYPGGLRTEAVLGLALALNRLIIICGLKCSSKLHWILIAFAWMFGLTYVIILLTPHFGYTVSPGEFMPKYDPSKGYNRSLQYYGSYIYGTPMVLTLLIYIYIFAYLLKLRLVHNSKVRSQERTIFIYAVTKFMVEFSLAAMFNHYRLPTTRTFHFAMTVGLIVSTLLLTPALYFVLYKNLRKEFFRFKKDSTLPVRSISSAL